MEKWIIISISNVEYQGGIIPITYFTARNEISGQEKDFQATLGTYEVGDAFYPTNTD